MFLRPRDIEIFEAIQKHGPLSSPYLYEFQKHLAHDADGFTKRLRDLFREGYLDRPKPLNNPLVMNDFYVYTLRDKAKEALDQVGKLARHSQPVGGGYPHMLMSAAITANIELQARARGVRYIPQEEILSRTPQDGKRPLVMNCAIQWKFEDRNRSVTAHSKRPAEPDQLFGIEDKEGARFFALEADRGTEPIERSNLDQNSLMRKILCYRDILTTKEYKRFGIPNLFPLIITTAEDRVENIHKLIEKAGKDQAKHFLVKWIPGFKEYFKTPPLMPEIFAAPFKRVGAEDFAF